MGLIKWTSGLVFVGIFVFAILMYSMQFGVDNDSGVLLSADSDYVGLQSQVSGNLSGIITDVNTSQDAFSKNPVVTGENAVQSGGQFTAGIGTMKNIAVNSISAGYKKIFGNDPYFGVIFSVIGAVVLFIGAAYAYKAIRGGDVD